jgi:hypothetical protein
MEEKLEARFFLADAKLSCLDDRKEQNLFF